MFEWIGKFIPPEIGGPIILAALIWGGAHYLYIGPEVGRRLGDLKWQPQCISVVAKLQQNERAAHAAKRKRAMTARDRVLREAEAAQRLAKRKADQLRAVTKGIFPKELRNLFDAITGQPGFTDSMTDMLTVPELPEIDDLDLPKIPVPLKKTSPKKRSGFCGCIVDASLALPSTHIDLALYSGTLRFYAPVRITRFEDVMMETARSKSCGKIPS